MSVEALTRQVEAGTGEGNQNDLTLHFGLGQHKVPVSLEILWPNGTRQTVPPVEVNRVRHIGWLPVTLAAPELIASIDGPGSEAGTSSTGAGRSRSWRSSTTSTTNRSAPW